MKNLQIYVSGVYDADSFLRYAQQAAYSMGLGGYVQSGYDDSLYVEVEGDEEELDNFLDWCSGSSGRGWVGRYNYYEGCVQHYSRFKVF